MIKRLIGILGTIGVVATVVFTILGRESYSSAVNFSSAGLSEKIVVDEPRVESVPESEEGLPLVDSVEVTQLETLQSVEPM